MNLKQLEVFLAVAETKSFTHGAERTFLTQSTVSQHISSLENEFGIRFLDRTGKGASLTEAGKMLYDYATQIMNGTKEMTLAIQRFKGMEQSVLRIGGSNIPGIYIIPRFLPFYQNAHPGVSVHLTQGTSHEIVQKLKKEQIELGIVGYPYKDDDIKFSPICCDEIILVVNSSHSWKNKREIVANELFEASFLFREEGSGTHSTVQAALSNAGVDTANLQVKARLGSNEAIKQAICQGNGVSFLSELSVKEECMRQELFPIKIKDVTISRIFYLIFRIGRELSPAGQAFYRQFIVWNKQPQTVALN
jgi:DNA-binding transcriptional LysR family regulator